MIYSYDNLTQGQDIYARAEYKAITPFRTHIVLLSLIMNRSLNYFYVKGRQYVEQTAPNPRYIPTASYEVHLFLRICPPIFEFPFS